MTSSPSPEEHLRAENAVLRTRLEEAEETLRAIRSGEVDALVVETDQGPRIFSLDSAQTASNRIRGDILAQVNDAVIAVDADERVTYLNAAAQRQYRVLASDALGHSLSEIYIRQGSRAETQAALWAALHEQGEWRGEITHRTHDGREMIAEKSVTALRDASGVLAGYVAVIRDVTERKQAHSQLVTMNERLLVASVCQHELTEKAEFLSVQLQTDLIARAAAEEALRESQHFIHSVLYNLFAFVGVMSADGTLIDANRSSLEGAGIPASEVIGKKFWDCYWWSYSPEIQARLRAACERAAQGEVVRYDVPVRMAGDTRVWIDFQVSPLRDTQGRITHLIPSGLEIEVRHAAEQALRESESRFRVMADGLPLVIWVHDAQGHLQFVNKAYCEFFGVTPEQIAGTGWQPLVHPEDLAAYAGEFSACVRDRRPFHAEVRVHSLAGQWRWLESHALPRFSESGEFLGMVGSSPDITDRKAIEQELVDHRKNLQLAVEQRTGELAESVAKLVAAERLAALGTLAAGLGHDIANITMPMRARLDMLARIVQGEEGRADIEAILRGVEHLSNVSAGMRLVALDPKRTGASAPVADLGHWCSQTTALFRSAVPRHISMECSMPSGVAIPVAAHLLAQAIFNLVQNAGEAMAGQKAGRIAVSAEVEAQTGSAGVVRMRVIDDGPGMPAAVLARCFEPYFSTKGRAISTGMGLGMVKGIVEAAGGRVLVESSPGKGTTFTLYIPVAPAADQRTSSPLFAATAAVSIRHPRTASLACLFLEQLEVSPQRTPRDMVPEASLWIVDDPDPARVAAYLDGHSQRRVVVLGAAASPGGGGPGKPGPAADVRVVCLSAMPTPSDLRQALMAAGREARTRSGQS